MLPVRRNYNQTWMPDIFNDFFDNTWMERPKATAPAINVLETPEAYQLELAAPGMTKSDFDVHLDEQGDLVINMEKKSDNKKEHEKGHYVRREFSYTKFQQTMLLPDDTDREAISAKVENGVLTVNLPKIKKVEPENTKKQITVE
ncbi:MAG: Hsp20/alpha crystallin family protein [Bacteroidales bacterium]|nr:Hsp20/alpha crystallin family protein [Bacteroidales bacterium]